MSHSFNKAAKVFVAEVDGNVCAFCATLSFPHPIKKKCWKEHRSVVLPDYQGVGIGGKLTDFVAEHMKQNGFHYISTTSNPAMIKARLKSGKWKVTRKGRTPTNTNGNLKGTTSSARITMSFEYIGDAEN